MRKRYFSVHIKLFFQWIVFGRKNHLITVCKEIKDHYTQEELQRNLAPKITELIDADGMVLSAEVDSASIIAEQLGITINISED